MKHILRCKKCGTYTLKDICPGCKNEAVQPMPAKYSPEDKYGKYRRKVKVQKLKENGLL